MLTLLGATFQCPEAPQRDWYGDLGPIIDPYARGPSPT
jgi:hypothetical protein